ncbi:hypothetical protein AVEN_251610-1 [Araneus ventricosus]|uniref:Uncharacterized protein n=1 Tax=Araneus ventricosus TaxID=182803 RepID=A0A4Y2EVE9_ARAVE|nr:hypothetical protein AVEN_251610-1 [Araneus ventricosus]
MGHRTEQVPQREVLIKTPPKGAGFQLAPAVCSLVDVMKRVNYLEPEKPLATKGQAQKRDEKTKNSGGLRFFKLPKLNFEAADYIDLIDWSNYFAIEPPLTMHIKDKDLKEMCEEEQFPALTFEEFPCHTQSVERCVKLISEAAMKVCGETARDGYIRAKFKARKELPTFDNKGQYYSNT